MKTLDEKTSLSEDLQLKFNQMVLDVRELKLSNANLKYQLHYRTLQSIHCGNLLKDLLKNLQAIDQTLPSELKNCHVCIEHCISQLKLNLNTKMWTEFRFRFADVHTDFYDGLLNNYPVLTEHDLRLCALIKLKMSIKEIASILNQPVNSVKVARKRLRKKLNLAHQSKSLIHLLASF
jgi:DNA-binding CsgD family transcriptional regulator